MIGRKQIYVLQDGADFYAFWDKACEKPMLTRTAPFKVRDFDVEAAEKARAWFKNLCSTKFDIHFVGGES